MHPECSQRHLTCQNLLNRPAITMQRTAYDAEDSLRCSGQLTMQRTAYGAEDSLRCSGQLTVRRTYGAADSLRCGGQLKIPNGESSVLLGNPFNRVLLQWPADCTGHRLIEAKQLSLGLRQKVTPPLANHPVFSPPPPPSDVVWLSPPCQAFCWLSRHCHVQAVIRILHPRLCVRDLGL